MIGNVILTADQFGERNSMGGKKTFQYIPQKQSNQSIAVTQAGRIK